MPIRSVPGTDQQYYLIAFDENGKERPEPDGVFLTETVRERATSVTDVFLASHGWKGDVPAAIQQYDAWITAMLGAESDRDAARASRRGFTPLIVGLHWPSLPWGDEEITGGSAVLSGSHGLDDIEVEVDAYSSRIASSPKARAALRTILDAAHREPGFTTLSPEVRAAYDTLFAESGVRTGDRSGRPGADQDGFDPAAIIAEAMGWYEEAPSGGQAAGVLGLKETVRDVLLMPLRQLSFWKMKDRARSFGETGGHELLISLQRASSARFHLMGHSFGCIVVSAMVAGPPNGTPLPRSVDSLFLVQGALSLWAYAEDIPYTPGTSGYFHRIVRDGLVRGPIVTTRSVHDTAVGRFYPLGAKLRKQVVLADAAYPEYGGIGAFGIQGTGQDVRDMPMQSAAYQYNFFGSGRISNLDASDIIRNGGGASGAHSDIAHTEVAHAFWSAVLAGTSEGAARAAGAEPLPPPPAGPVTLGVTTDLLGVDDSETAPAPSPLPGAPEWSSREQRWINTELEDHRPDEPLEVGKWYTLAFDVDVEARRTAAGSTRFEDANLFLPGTTELLLTVQLDSDDFEISDRTRPLRVGPTGRSRGKARFDITPKHDGASRIRATFHKDGNFIQQMELTLGVGATATTPMEVTSRGRQLAAAGVVQPRDIGISIAPAAGGGYDCVVWGSVSARAHLPIQQAYLGSAIDALRREVTKIVMYRNAAGQYVFQTSVDIPVDDRSVALRTMARAGALLFQKMFFGPAAGADSKAVGEWLRKMASEPGPRVKFQIVAESTPVPWQLLYVGDASTTATLDWDGFIGMRHIIEQIPLQNTLTVSDCAIPSDRPELAVSINLNSEIDRQMGADYVAQQRSFWADARRSGTRVRVTPRTTSAEVMQALAAGTTDDQILYFYCHAASAGLTETGGPDASCIVMSDARITLSDLSLDAPTTTPLRGSPLVFINACESAEMSPAFYDGFVPYFMAKGARGVVGTETTTPALFALQWARRFFERFLDGQPLGETFLELRREFLQQHGNPLGLLYAVHCDGDTRVMPALKVTA